MILPDVNVLIYAHRPESPDHDEYRRWLDSVVNRGDPFALSELVLSGFVRIVTNPRVYKQPTPLDGALGFAERLRSAPRGSPRATRASALVIVPRTLRPLVRGRKSRPGRVFRRAGDRARS